MTPYQQHRERWLGCTACPLHERRTKVVLARGKLPCDALLVGEAPGPSENLVGIPFVGPAGKLLDSIIAESLELAGVEVAKQPRLAFTNLVCCIPLEYGTTKFERPPDEAVEACSERLAEMVALANPKVLICVGTEATTWLAPSKKNGLRGVDLGDWDIGESTTIPITHPAAILRANEAARGLMRRRVVVDLANVWRKLCQS